MKGSAIKQPQLRAARTITLLEEPLAQLKALSDEQKTFINEKYDLSKMQWGTHEYNLLMGELCDMGILSSIPNGSGLNIISVNTDAAGNITSYMTKMDDISEDTDIMNWFSQSIALNSRKYEKIQKNVVSSLEDKMFVRQFEAYKTIGAILSELQQN